MTKYLAIIYPSFSDTVVDLSQAKCQARYFKTEDYEMTNKGTMQNKSDTPKPTIPTTQETHIPPAKLSVATVSSDNDNKSKAKHRQNDKTFFYYKPGKLKNSILAYTGDSHVKTVTSDKRGEMIKYKVEAPSSQPQTYLPHNMFYAGSNMDNPYLTWVTVPR
jgi:hypothetical protein